MLNSFTFQSYLFLLAGLLLSLALLRAAVVLHKAALRPASLLRASAH